VADSDAVSAPRTPGRGRDRPVAGRRTVAVLVLMMVVTGTGFALDRGLGPNGASRGGQAGARSGAWFCPHGGTRGWHGWLALTNPGPITVRVRVTSYGPNGQTSQSRFAVPASRLVYRSIPAQDAAASTEVEYFGGWVGASSILRAGDAGSAVTAERCVSAPSGRWFLPDETTATGQTAYAIVMNPFWAPAEFEVALRTERQNLTPGALTPYVLPARRSVAIKINDYLLQGPKEETVTVRIVSRIGRTIAGSQVVSSGAVRGGPGVPGPRVSWAFPASGYVAPGRVVAMNPGGARSDMSLIGQGRSAQRLLSGPNGLSLLTGAVATFDAGGPKDAGVLVQSTNRRPVVAVLRLTSPGGDTATVSGAANPLASWLTMPSLPPSGGRAWVLLENPGRDAVQVTLMPIGTIGTVPAPIGPIGISGGRTIHVPLRPSVGSKPASVLVRVSGGSVVAACLGETADGSGFDQTLGVPIPPGVSIGPRA
jgi:hypothetical protein